MDIIEEFKNKINEILSSLREALKGIRTNRPSSALVEDIKIDYHGQLTPLQHIASISVSPPREIVIRVWEEDMVKKTAKAIEDSDLNLSPNVDSDNVIRIFLPELSQERREELISYAKKKIEEYRIRVRVSREEFNKRIEKMFEEDEISEDNKFRLKDEIQSETEKANDEIEELFENKKKTIL